LGTHHTNALDQLAVTISEDTSPVQAGGWLSSRSPRAEQLTDDAPSAPTLYQHEVLLTAADLPPERRTQLLGAWYELLHSCPLGLNVLIDDIDAPGGYSDARLLSIARATEAIARRRYPVSESAMTTYTERMSRLQEVVADPQLRRWLRGRLLRAYEPSLEERGRRMLADVAPSVSQLVPSDRFAAAFSKRRNDYTHEDPKSSSSVDHVETFWLLIRAHYLLVAWVLVAIGFKPAEVQRFLETNTTYNQLSHQLPVGSR
jgi:ApeA N-terminal domain 1